MEKPAVQIGHLVDAHRAKDRWTLKKPPIGGGGQGWTYRAHRHSDGIEACVKVLKDQRSEDRRRRFFEEVNALAAITNPRVPRLIETNATADRVPPGSGAVQLYLASELVAGDTLARRVEEGGPIPVRDATEMALRILETLHELHPTRVHRDLKPENVILRNGDELDPVLVDFGLSASGDDGPNTPLDQELGNRFLRLPEMAPGSARKRDAVTDVTFTAALLLFAVTGERPSFLADEAGRLPHQRGNAQRIIGEAPDMDGMRLLGVFDRAFQHSIEKRFGTAAELADALRASLEEREERGTAEDYLRSLWEPSGEVTPEQVEEFATLNKRVLSWAQGVLYELRPLPEWVNATMMAGHCPKHRTRTAVCQEMGFRVVQTTGDGQQRTTHVLPHFIAEVVGHDVVLRGEHDGVEALLLRSPLGGFEPSTEDRRSVKEFLVDCLRKTLAAGKANPLRLEFGDGPGFDDTDPHAGDAIRRVVSFAIINEGQDFIADCSVRFRGIVPPLGAVFAPGALLRDGIDLPPGQRRFVRLAYYDEEFPTGHVSQRIGLCTPPSNALGGGFGSLVISEEVRSYEIVLEASAPGVPAVLERVTLSVDAEKRLRMEKLSVDSHSD
ncbi:serine/threonine protein kinase [Roseicella aquatilis]|nr:protein kinase [Roseicella aquatilis]